MTNPVDELAGDDLLRAVAEVEGVDPSELEPWEVFKRVLELVHLRETDFRAAMRLPPMCSSSRQAGSSPTDLIRSQPCSGST